MQAESLEVEDVIAHIIGDAANAVSSRPGETQESQNDRVQAATTAMMTFQPRDAVEAMIASRCVMFHELLVDSISRLLRGDQTVSQSNILGTDKAIGNDLRQFERYRTEHTASVPEPVAQETIVPAADPAQFGGGEANEAWPTAAQMAGFNRQTRRALDRQVRKRINQVARVAELAGSLGPGVKSIHNAAATTASATSAG